MLEIFTRSLIIYLDLRHLKINTQLGCLVARNTPDTLESSKVLAKVEVEAKGEVLVQAKVEVQTKVDIKK
jgi:hypothetical protein